LDKAFSNICLVTEKCRYSYSNSTPKKQDRMAEAKTTENKSCSRRAATSKPGQCNKGSTRGPEQTQHTPYPSLESSPLLQSSAAMATTSGGEWENRVSVKVRYYKANSQYTVGIKRTISIRPKIPIMKG
jgi:hypothetical protein